MSSSFYRLPVLLLITWCSSSFAAEVFVPVTRILDGDTIQVDIDGSSKKVRLLEVDCPERDQPGGKEATGYLRNLLHETSVILDSQGSDRYGRILATVYLDKANINKLLVKDGMCWAYRRYLKDKSYLDLEKQARDQKTGLWHDNNPVPPWDWRRGKRIGE